MIKKNISKGSRLRGVDSKGIFSVVVVVVMKRGKRSGAGPMYERSRDWTELNWG